MSDDCMACRYSAPLKCAKHHTPFDPLKDQRDLIEFLDTEGKSSWAEFGKFIDKCKRQIEAGVGLSPAQLRKANESAEQSDD